MVDDTTMPEVGDDLSPKALGAPAATDWATVGATGYAVLAVGSAAVSGYHGLRRGGVLGMVLWGVAGFFFPIVTPTVAYAQGFGRRK